MSNFLADNVDWIVPMALLVVTSLYGHFKKRKIAEATAKAKPTPEVSRQIAKQIAMLQQKVEAKEPAPAQPRVAPRTALPDEGVPSVEMLPIEAPMDKPIEAAQRCDRHQRLRRAVIWSEILRRPQL